MPKGIFFRTAKHRKHISEALKGSNHQYWKGNNVSYKALHDWLTRNYGRPQECINCGTTTAKKYEWANISGKYLRDINDFVRLCTKCHMTSDGRLEGLKRTQFQKGRVLLFA